MNSGIYIITNTANGKFYVGSAFDIANRKSGHFCELRKNRHRNARLQNAFNKYGESVFEFRVIERCPKDDCITREQFYIDTMRPFYNICPIAMNCAGVVRTAETKEKMRQAKVGFRHTEESKRKIGQAAKGRRKTAEAIAKFKKTLSSRPQAVTEQWKERLRERTKNRSDEVRAKVARGRWKPVRQLTTDGVVVREWPSGQHAGEELGIAKICISNCCRGKQKKAGGFRWEFAEKS